MQILVEAIDALSLGNCSISRDVRHGSSDFRVFASFLEDIAAIAFLRSADMEEIQRVQTKMKRLDQAPSAAWGWCCDF